MSKYTWRELEPAEIDTVAEHVAETECRAEQIAREVQKRLARLERIVDGLGEVKGEIVRCRDCAYMHTVRSWYSDNLVDECWLHADPESGALGKEPTEPDGFCAWGERKGDTE